MKKYIYILSLLVISLSACKKEEPIGGTAVQDMSGEWWVQIDGAGDYYKVVTSNTADNSNTKMWVDLTGFWGTDVPPAQLVKARVDVNTADKTFSITNVDNVQDSGYGEPGDPPIKITVKNGKVITDGAIGPVSKQKTDAISLEVSFSDDQNPGTIYKLVGYHRTKFPDDDH